MSQKKAQSGMQAEAGQDQSAREEILGRLRSKNKAGQLPVAEDYPLPELVLLGDLDASQERFEANLQLMGGAVLSLAKGRTLEETLKLRFPQAENFYSAVPNIQGMSSIHDLATAQQADKVDVMVIRAAFGIAETGSVFVSEKEFPGPLAYMHLAQNLVILLSPQQLTANMHTAYQQRGEFLDADYGVLMSGPSATADIQGVLVRGAQGARSLSVLWAEERI